MALAPKRNRDGRIDSLIFHACYSIDFGPPIFAHVRWHPLAHLRVLKMEQLAVSIGDTTRALGVGRTTIYAMIADGRLEAFKLGRRRLVKAESIRRLIAAHD